MQAKSRVGFPEAIAGQCVREFITPKGVGIVDFRFDLDVERKLIFGKSRERNYFGNSLHQPQWHKQR